VPVSPIVRCIIKCDPLFAIFLWPVPHTLDVDGDDDDDDNNG